MSCLYILEINLLLVALFANIFSQPVGCLCVLCICVLCMVSFAVQKLFNLIRSYLFIFVFILITLGGGSKKNCYDLCHRVYSRSLLKLVFIKLVMPSKHLVLCRPLLLLPSVFPSIRAFSRGLVLHIAEALELQLQHQSFKMNIQDWFL